MEQHIATKQDFVNLLVIPEEKDNALTVLRAIYDTPDDTGIRVASGSEETGDLVLEEIPSLNPVWKQKGFSSRAEIKDLIGQDYPDDNLNAAIAEKSARMVAMNAGPPLSTRKAKKLAAIRSQARTIIMAKYPDFVQLNAANGIYPAVIADPMKADIAAVIVASNLAEDAVDTATTKAEVDAVTPNWPVL